MFRLFSATLTAAFGLAFAAPLFAADTQTNARSVQTTQPYDGYKVAMKKCNNLPQAEQAKCIVNIRPTESSVANPAMAAGSDGNVTVKDGSAQKDAEYAAAVRECESVAAAEKERCVENAREHFGRM